MMPSNQSKGRGNLTTNIFQIKLAKELKELKKDEYLQVGNPAYIKLAQDDDQEAVHTAIRLMILIILKDQYARKINECETTSEIQPVVHLDENMAGIAFVAPVDYISQVAAQQKKFQPAHHMQHLRDY